MAHDHQRSVQDPSLEREEHWFTRGEIRNMADSVGRADRHADLQNPEWQSAVQGALLELDQDKLRARVAAAEAAIFNRLQAISQNPDHQSERQAIEDALTTLRVLKREALGFPDWGKK